MGHEGTTWTQQQGQGKVEWLFVEGLQKSLISLLAQLGNMQLCIIKWQMHFKHQRRKCHIIFDKVQSRA